MSSTSSLTKGLGLRDWDVLCNQNPVQEIALIANGSHPGNCISVLRVFSTTSQNNMLILQESCIDSSGALVLYSPVELPAINIVTSGEGPSCIPLLQSGLTIYPDGRSVPEINQQKTSNGVSTSSSNAEGEEGGGGSLITEVLQQKL
ncbi:hypothetical protein ACH5RR_030574 [Cinchona calisaya]|uniref:HD-Zip IV C-terminal domain-containing protein n=1 Tax=Cinchona calisaya TaxID=153742 RepID=A0ABD2Z062_9GENT